jgi:hypothetical protein
MRRVALVLLAILALTAGCTATTSPGRAPAGTAPSSTAPALATVPDVVGHNAAVAVDELKRAGFSNVDLGTVDGHKFVALPQNWTVKTQSAKAGDRLPRDAKIVLGCARNS